MPLLGGGVFKVDATGQASRTSRSTNWDLGGLLRLMADESDPRLAPGYLKLDEVSRLGKVPTPSCRSLMDVLVKNGFAASRSHVEANAVKSDCSMATCISLSRQLAQQN
eukprot:SM000031S11577  [mRNA]  locus=s31:478713:479452:- [translate_table: standard]